MAPENRIWVYLDNIIRCNSLELNSHLFSRTAFLAEKALAAADSFSVYLSSRRHHPRRIVLNLYLHALFLAFVQRKRAQLNILQGGIVVSCKRPSLKLVSEETVYGRLVENYVVKRLQKLFLLGVQRNACLELPSADPVFVGVVGILLFYAQRCV